MEPSLEDIQDGILDRLHAGETVDREQVLRAHPEHREALEQFFAVVELVETAPEPEEPPPARLGEFRILREIGRGGMGVVYEAEQTSLRRRVALKVLPPALRADRQLYARFRREAEAAARLRHPGVVPVYSCGEAGGAPFYAMERVEGDSLAERIRRRRRGEDAGLPADPAEYRRAAVETAARVADALAYAHGRGILHRDVKPANILIEPDGTPRLTDFGLALDLQAAGLTVAGEVLGSPQYMSPEQAFRREQPLDARTDVYSLAVTLYELLSLQLPYAGTSAGDLLSALGAGELIPLHELDPGVPADLERVVMHALRKEPEQRYASAAEFAQDLRAVLAGEPVAARPLARRPRRRAALALLLALLLAGAAAVALQAFGTGGNAGPGGAAPRGGLEEIEQLLAGTHPDPAPVLERWFHPEAQLRSVIARGAEAPCRVAVSYRHPEQALTDVVAVCTLEYSVHHGPWQRHAPPLLIPVAGGPHLVQGPTYFLVHDLRELLGPALGRDSAHLAQRLELRLLRAAGGLERIQERLYAGTPLPRDGTAHTWPLDERTLYVYDEFPDDFPTPVSGPELDAAMTAAVAPAWLRYLRLDYGGVTLELHYEGSSGQGPLPLACELELYTPDGEAPVGVASYAQAAGPAGEAPAVEHTFYTALRFALAGDGPGAATDAFRMDLELGRLDSLRLVFRPSRAVARSRPDFDRYWAGSLEATVPLRN